MSDPTHPDPLALLPGPDGGEPPPVAVVGPATGRPRDRSVAPAALRSVVDAEREVAAAAAAGCRYLVLPGAWLWALRREPGLRAHLGRRWQPVVIDLDGWVFDLNPDTPPVDPVRPRVFGIGLNKTATTSLQQVLEQLGLKTLHWGGPAAHDAVRQAQADDVPLLSYLGDGWDGVCDVRAVTDNFDHLDRDYPGSRFVLTVRDEDEWVASRRRHVERNRRNRALGSYSGNFLTVDEDRWRQERREHHDRVARHFADRPRDLLTLDICAGDGVEALASFLDKSHPPAAFPRSNVDSRAARGS